MGNLTSRIVHRANAALVACLGILVGAAPAITHAATFSWNKTVNGTGVSTTWSSGTNWSAAPVSANDTTLSFNLSYGVNTQVETNTLTNDVANPFSLNVMTFSGSPTAGSGSSVATVNITGSPLAFVANGATNPVVNLNANRSNGQPVAFNVQSNVTLGSNLTFQGNGNATYTVSGNISGTGLSITKNGTSSLTLNGTNDYTGGTTLNAGTLILGGNSALGTSGVTVTGTSSIGFTNGVNISNAIDRGSSTVTYFMSSATAATATYSGALTGSGTINIGNSGSGNNQTNLFFADAGGFTGNVVGASGNANGADYFRFTDIGDGGNFTFQKSGNRGGVTYNGTSAITFNTRQIAIGTGFGGGGTYGVNGNNIPQNAFQNIATDAAHTVTFTSNLSIGTISSNSVFYFDGSNTGNNTFAGDIGDATGNNTLSIGKTGAGKWILTGNNSYEGNTIIANGTLAVNAMDAVANNQPLGKGSLIMLGFNTTSGVLEYIGSANSTTDKQVQIGTNTAAQTASGSILNNGSGSLTFTNAAFNPSVSATANRTLTLGGNFSGGANEIQGVIQNNTGSPGLVALTVSGSRWTLSGNNTYTGVTTVTGGTLQFAKTPSLYGGNSTLWTASRVSVRNGGTLALNVGGGSDEFSTGNVTTLLTNLGGANGTSTNGFAAGSAIGFDTTNASGNFTVADIIANSTGSGGGSVGVRKLGTGTLVLAGNNTYNGTTVISGGTVAVGHVNAFGAANNSISVATGATIDMNATSLASARNYSVTIAGSGAGGAGAIVNTGADAFSNLGIQNLTLSANATVGGSGRWDVRGSTDGVLNLAGFTLTKNGTNMIAIVNGNATTSGSIVVNAGTLSFTRYNISGTGSIDVGSGATLQLENYTTGASRTVSKGINLSGGTLRVIGANLSTLGSFSSQIGLSGNNTVDIAAGLNLTASGGLSGSGSLTKISTGTLTLSGNNSYNGATTVAAGTLALGASGSIANTPLITVESGATFDVSAVSGFALATGQTLIGAGTVVGNMDIADGTTFEIGAGVGTKTIAGNMAFGANSTWDVSAVIAGASGITSDDTLYAITFGSGFGVANLAGVDSSTPLGIYTLISSNQTFASSGIGNWGAGNQTSIGGGKFAYFQQGSLQLVVVPEPATMTLLGAAVAALGIRFARRRSVAVGR